MADDLRAGIIGAGFIGAVHANAVRAARGVLSRVAASTPARSAAAAQRLGATAPAESAEALIDAEDVDVVHICTPNTLHVPLARRALAAGKAVICEKPLATELDDALALAAQAAAADVVTAVPFVYRFYPTVREARARIAAGQAGHLHLLHGHYLQDWQASKDAGWRGDPTQGGAHRAFADIGVHWCDLVEFTSGHRITRLVARTHGGGTESILLFDTDRGASGSVVVSQVALGRKNQLVIRIEGATAAYGFDQQQPETLQIGAVAENRVLHRGTDAATIDAARYSVLPPGHPQGYQDCFNAFVADSYSALRGTVPDGLPTFDDGARAAALVHAVVASSTSSTWVEVPT